MDEKPVPPTNGESEKWRHALTVRSLWLLAGTAVFIVAWFSFPALGFIFPRLFNATPSFWFLALYICAFPIALIAVVLAEAVSFFGFRKPAFNAVSMLISVSLLGGLTLFTCLPLWLTGLGRL